jgi:DNA-binding response OmpR family regulator
MAITNSSLRILLVDDDVNMRTTLTRLLTGEGYDVCHADSGEQAISMYARRPLGLIITQLILGGKDGFEIIMEMRRELVCARFIATARAGWLPADLCARVAGHLGAHCVLMKPFLPEHLLAAVRDALR